MTDYTPTTETTDDGLDDLTHLTPEDRSALLAALDADNSTDYEDIDADDSADVDGDMDDGEREEEGRSGNAEAARYRRKLRETESERDTLASRLESYQRAEVIRLASSDLAVGEDVFDIGRINLADLVDDDGRVVPELVQTAVHGLVETRPGLKKNVQRGPSSTGAGHRGSVGGASKTWKDLLG